MARGHLRRLEGKTDAAIVRELTSAEALFGHPLVLDTDEVASAFLAGADHPGDPEAGERRTGR